MSLVEHLEELRTTLIRVMAVVLVSFIVCYGFGEHISEVLLRPLRSVLSVSGQGQIVYLGLLDKVISQLQLAFGPLLYFLLHFGSLKSGAFSSLPYMITKRVVKPFIFVGFLLFMAAFVLPTLSFSR